MGAAVAVQPRQGIGVASTQGGGDTVNLGLGHGVRVSRGRSMGHGPLPAPVGAGEGVDWGAETVGGGTDGACVASWTGAETVDVGSRRTVDVATTTGAGAVGKAGRAGVDGCRPSPIAAAIARACAAA